MSEQDSLEQLTEKHRSHRPPAEPGKETTPPVGYMTDRGMRRMALRGVLAAVEQKFAGKADRLSSRQLMRMAVEQYRKSLESEPANGMLG